jgi:hypothetical protein
MRASILSIAAILLAVYLAMPVHAAMQDDRGPGRNDH